MKFRGHETFFIRKGWIYKGLKQVKNNPTIFVDKENKPTDVLGIGTNMVKSLRYWMQAVGLTEEKRQGNLRYQEFTTLGDIIWKYDKYVEEDGSLWMIHYNLACNKDLATSWYWFFNEFNVREFSKDEFTNSLDGYVKYNEEGMEISVKSLEDDYNCLINTYISRKKMNSEKVSPENNIDCPLGALNLLDITDKKSKIIKRANLNKDSVNPLIVLSVIVDQYEKSENNSKEVKISTLLNDECNIGKIFGIDLNILNYYLDKLQQMKYIRVIRTAGLDVIRIDTELKWNEILEKYYEEINFLGSREENE